MLTSENGIKFIAGFERYRPTPYDDGFGYMTIGFGHRIKEGEVFTSLTEDQARQLMSADLSMFEGCINDNVDVDLNQNQFDALASLCFNVGQGVMTKSHLLDCLNNGDFAGAAAEFPKWDHSNGQVVLGLYKRRLAEQAVFNTPV